MGVSIFSSGGETADIGDVVRTIVVDSTVTTRMKRSDVVINNIKPGDVIVGLSSSGKASYEDEYNSGIGSNGLTSARHDVFSNYIALKYPESFDPHIPDELIYSGDLRLTDEIGELEANAGKLVLSPTRTYAPVIINVLKKYRKEIHGMIHCSGGAQTKVLNFISNMHIVKDHMFPVPPIFGIIREQSGTPWKEMYKVFNMGHRFEIYVNQNIAQNIISISKKFDIDARIIGHCNDYETKKLTISGEMGTFTY
jgi:phosphoribosylformylglycinamidine cyclo-ligase